ncbi:MAG: hypothetical protein GY950_32970, partial [bacterium]|nr:hypothetical protein [bacterium]
MLYYKRMSVCLAAIIFITVFGADIRAGTVRGKITAVKNSPRRTARRYPAKYQQKAGQVKPIPAIAMIRGLVKGFPPRASSKSPEIVQEDFEFRPALLVVPVNTTVAFPNKDLEFHNVFSYSRIKRFDLGRYHKGESKSVRFKKPGIGKIYCEIHEWMRAVIVVVENPFYAVADEKGNYEIKNIPAGKYKLVVWKIDHKKITSDIEVPGKGTLEINFAL